jgi:hypothetical protein
MEPSKPKIISADNAAGTLTSEMSGATKRKITRPRIIKDSTRNK